ncbi:hypothetical protein JZ751_021722 [Albula glossodonta]|uniref:Uncharacterized protein n=1 Tax=Albula glossodonta TaxID=121402 RepID=A0A8T2NIR7_9TELE|nr:hypothetical protein JZ751_021722 [Albula glossodonta]
MSNISRIQTQVSGRGRLPFRVASLSDRPRMRGNSMKSYSNAPMAPPIMGPTQYTCDTDTIMCPSMTEKPMERAAEPMRPLRLSSVTAKMQTTSCSVRKISMHGGAGQGAQHLRHDVEEGAEQGHLRADQVGEGDGRVDVAAADVAHGLDERGGSQPEAEGHVQDVVGRGRPAEGRAHPEEHEEHGAVELGEHRPPEQHGPELPHVDREKNRKHLREKGRKYRTRRERGTKKDPL